MATIVDGTGVHYDLYEREGDWYVQWSLPGYLTHGEELGPYATMSAALEAGKGDFASSAAEPVRDETSLA